MDGAVIREITDMSKDVSAQLQDVHGIGPTIEVAPVGPGTVAAEGEAEAEREGAGHFILARTAIGVCLHRVDGCWRAKGYSFKEYEMVYEEAPRPGSFDRFCRDCWPRGGPEVDDKKGGEEKQVDESDGSSGASPHTESSSG